MSIQREVDSLPIDDYGSFQTFIYTSCKDESVCMVSMILPIRKGQWSFRREIYIMESFRAFRPYSTKSVYQEVLNCAPTQLEFAEWLSLFEEARFDIYTKPVYVS